MNKHYSIVSAHAVYRLSRLLLCSLGGLLFASLLLITACPAFAQSVDLITGEAGTGTSAGFATTTDPDGNVYVAGYFSGTATISGTQVISAGGYDIFVAKYNAAGVLQWLRRAGGSENDSGVGIAADASGVYVTGSFGVTASFDTPSSPTSNTLVSAGNNDIFVAKYDVSGTLQWLRQAGGSSDDLSNKIVVDASGVYVTGGVSVTASFDSPTSNTLVSAGGLDIFVAKYDASGVLQWLRRAGGSKSDIGIGIAVYANAVYVTGTFSGTADFDTPASNTLVSAGNNDIFVAKYDASGVLQWSRRAGGVNSISAGYGIGVNASGVYVTGDFFGTIDFNTPSSPTNNTLTIGSNNMNIFVAKYDDNGVVQWLRRAGPTDEYTGSNLALDATGVYVTGNFLGTANFNTPSSTASNTLVAAGNIDVFVAKYDTDGVVQWLRRAGGTTYSASYGLAVDVRGVYVTGYVQSTANFNTPSAFGSNELVVPVSGTTTYFLARWTNPLQPTLTGFAPMAATVCAGSVATFTATVGNVTGAYDYTLTNGTSSTTGTTSSTPFSQTWTVAGSGSQSFTLTIAYNGASATASTTLTVNALSPDYQPLVDLYNATNGDGWTNKTGWLQGCNPCTGNGGNPWSGIICSGGRVTQINLSGRRLSGTLPSSLSALTNLQTLGLNNNQLSGSIPTSLSALNNLQFLNLSSNQLSGSIPPSLSALNNLQSLDLYNNQLSGSIPSSLGTLTKLRSLYLYNNQLSGSIPASLSALTNLRQLFLNSNQLSGSIPTSLSALSNLLGLYLDNNQLSGSIPPSLGALTHLVSLSLNNNQLSGCYPSSLSALCGITIDFSNNTALPDGGSAAGFTAFCNTGFSSNLAIGISPNPSLTITQGNTTILTATGADTYIWSTSETTNPISVSVAGPYSVTGTTTEGCSNTATATVSVATPVILAGTTIGTITACAGTTSGNIQLFTVSASNLTADLVATAPAGFEISTQSARGYGSSVRLTPTSGSVVITTLYVRSSATASAGTITGQVSLTSSGASSQTVAVSATVNALPTITIAATPSLTINAGQSTTLTASGATSYVWSDASTGPTLTVNPTTTMTYSVTGTTGGCSAMASVAVSVTACSPPTVSLLNTGPGSCYNVASLSVSSSGVIGSLTWYNSGNLVFTSSPQTVTAGTSVAGNNGSGSADHQLAGPRGVYVDASGAVYVADQNNNRIQKWAAGATSGTTVAGGHGPGSADNQLDAPAGVYVDASGVVYVADQNNNRIQKWAVGASSGTTVAGGHGQGSADNQLFNPSGVYVDASGSVYVADYFNHRIQKWAVGASSGTTVAGGNGFGSNDDQLNNPEGVYVDESGAVYIANQGNHRIQKWAAGATSGTTVAGGNGQGSDDNQLFNPYGVYVDKSGAIYIADTFNNRIQKWAAGATSGTTVAGGNGQGSADNQLSFPQGVYVDGSGAIYVADVGNNRIQRWAATVNPVYVPSSAGTYSVVVTTADGCMATTNAITLTAPPSVSITTNPSGTSGAVTLTAGGSVTLTASGASAYTWSNGSTDNSLIVSNVISATVLSVTGVTDGCSATASVAVSVTQPAPVVLAGTATGSITACAGTASGNVQSFTVSASNLTADLVATAPVGFEISSSSGSGFGASVNLTPTSGSVVITTLYVRSSATASAGSLSGSVSLTSSGASSQTVAVSGTITALSPDYQPLVDFYNATNGAGWRTKTNWLTGCSPCGWYGVTCDGNGRVTQLDLDVNQLSGSIPASLSALTNLQRLDLNYNQLGGEIPASLGALTNLQYLVLYNNQLSGEIPASLSALTNLQQLDLSTNQLSGEIPASLGALTNLQKLDFAQNQLIGSIPASLSALTNLQSLFLFENQLSGSIPASLSALTNLQQLELDQNQLSGSIPASLSALTNLQDLFLFKNQLSGEIPASLGALTNLQLLNLASNQLSGSLPASLSALTNLQVLLLNNNQLSGSIPAGLGALTNLRTLNLSQNQLSGCYASSLKTFCGISTKNFSGNTGLPNGGSAAGFTAFCNTGFSSNLAVSIGASPSLTITQGQFTQLTASGADSYSWSTGETANPISVSVAGPYSVTGTTTEGCSNTATATVSVTVATPAILAGTATGSITACAGTASGNVQSVTVSASNLTADLIATAPVGFEISSSSGSGFGSSVSLTPTSGSVVSTMLYVRSSATAPSGSLSGTVSLTTTGASSQTVAVSGTVNALPTITIAATPSLTINAGQSTTLTASGATSYLWSNGATTAATSVSIADTYSVTGTSSGCSSSTSVTVLSRDCQTTVTASVVQLCVDQVLSLTATAQSQVSQPGAPVLGAPAGPVYSWVAPTGASLSSTSSSVISASFTTSGVKTFTATVTTLEGCVSTSTVSVTVNALPTPVVTAAGVPGNLTICAGTTTTLTASGGTAYNWSNGATADAITVSPTSTTAYSVTVTNASGCVSSTSVSVTVNPTPVLVVTANPSSTIVPGQSTTLTASGASSYTWSTGETTPSISVTTAATYSLTGVTSQGCSATLSTASTAPFAITGVSQLSCTPITPNRYVISISPLYSGLSGQPISFEVVNETVPTTDPGPYTLQLYTDNPVILLKAGQAGTAGETTYRYNWLAACTSQPTANTPPTVLSPLSNQTATVGQLFSLNLSGVFTDAETPTQLVLSASGLPAGLSLQGNTLTGTPSLSGTVTVTLTATDPGSLSALTQFGLTVLPAVTANTAPSLVSGVGNQTATVGQGFSLNLSGVFTDAETPTSLVLSVSGLPAGLSLQGTTISGSPSSTVGSPLSVTLVATDPGSLSAATSFMLTILPAPTSTGVFAITAVSTLSCTPVFTNRIEVSFQPQYAGLNGQPIRFSVANELSATTAPGPYSLQLYLDNPRVTLKASQGGSADEASFVYDWLAACTSQPPTNTAPVVVSPIPAQYATLGQGFSYTIPVGTFTDAETPTSLTLSVTGLPAGLSFTAPATISGTASVSGTSTVTVTATDPGGLSVSTPFMLTVSPVVVGNTAPVVVSPISPQVATVGQGFTLGLGSVFSDAETPTGLVFSATGLPAGLSIQGSSISGTPSTSVGSPLSITVTATDPGGLSVSTPFTLTINPAVVSPSGSFTITGVNLVSCNPISAGQRSVSFSPIYSGVTGSPISFSVANELASTTAVGPYTLRLYTDNPTITLVAVQDNQEARYVYNWLAVCGVTPPANTAPVVLSPIGNQQTTVGSGFSFSIPANTFSDAETPNALVLSVSGLPTGLSFTAPATISGTASVTGTSLVTVTATDPGGLGVSTQFVLMVNPVVSNPGTGSFTITGVTSVSCSPLSAGQRSVSFTPIYSGTSGSPISFSVVNELASTTVPGLYTLSLYTDNPSITLVAVQDNQEARYVYNWLSACTAPARLGAGEAEGSLQVRVLGNPVPGEWAELEISGVGGQSVQIHLVDQQGRIVHQQRLGAASGVERVSLPVGNRSGSLLVQVETATQRVTVKLLRP